MQAMNGSGTCRARGFRLVGTLVAVVALVAMAVPSLASAAKSAPKYAVTNTYVALGDSLAFGYSQQLYNEGESKGDPASGFEGGYPKGFRGSRNRPIGTLQLVNLACPGETTESMIGNNPALIGGLNAALAGKVPKEITGESPCGYQEAWNAFHKNGLGGPLHFPYVGKSQLEATIETIALNTLVFGTPVTHLTIDIGANDALHVLGKCEAEAKYAVEHEPIKGEIELEVYEAILKGEITPEEAPAYGEKLGKERGEQIAKECISKEVGPLYEQVNSNLSGILVAIRDGSFFGGINYEGPIDVIGNYNPYGAVFVAGEELLPGTNELSGLGNLLQAKTAAAFGACFSNTQGKFNPRTKREPELLQKYTNMANFTEFEGKKNGPDIHATPQGYKVMASIANHECPGS
jgi:hypothetical protein